MKNSRMRLLFWSLFWKNEYLLEHTYITQRSRTLPTPQSPQISLHLHRRQQLFGTLNISDIYFTTPAWKKKILSSWPLQAPHPKYTHVPLLQHPAWIDASSLSPRTTYPFRLHQLPLPIPFRRQGDLPFLLPPRINTFSPRSFPLGRVTHKPSYE